MASRRTQASAAGAHRHPAAGGAPLNAAGTADGGQAGSTVTVAEALEALKALRAEMTDLRMLLRAARSTDGSAAPEPRPDRASR
jgi:hypothetical protein